MKKTPTARTAPKTYRCHKSGCAEFMGSYYGGTRVRVRCSCGKSVSVRVKMDGWATLPRHNEGTR